MGSSQALTAQRLVAERRWRLGAHARGHPSRLMAELYRALAACGVSWKKVAPYNLKCRAVVTVHPTRRVARQSHTIQCFAPRYGMTRQRPHLATTERQRHSSSLPKGTRQPACNLRALYFMRTLEFAPSLALFAGCPACPTMAPTQQLAERHVAISAPVSLVFHGNVSACITCICRLSRMSDDGDGSRAATEDGASLSSPTGGGAGGSLSPGSAGGASENGQAVEYVVRFEAMLYKVRTVQSTTCCR